MIPDKFTLDTPVNQKHLDHGIAWDCNECPLALALKDALRKRFGADPDYVVVGYTSALVGLEPAGPLFRARWATKSWAHRLIAAFDSSIKHKHKYVKPRNLRLSFRMGHEEEYHQCTAIFSIDCETK